jgi:hypothetical protein
MLVIRLFLFWNNMRLWTCTSELLRTQEIYFQIPTRTSPYIKINFVEAEHQTRKDESRHHLGTHEDELGDGPCWSCCFARTTCQIWKNSDTSIKRIVNVAKNTRSFEKVSQAKHHTRVSYLITPQRIPRSNVSTITQQRPYVLGLMLFHKALQLHQLLTEEWEL